MTSSLSAPLKTTAWPFGNSTELENQRRLFRLPVIADDVFHPEADFVSVIICDMSVAIYESGLTPSAPPATRMCTVSRPWSLLASSGMSSSAAPLVAPSGNIPALRQPWSAAVPILDGSNSSMLFQLASLMLWPAGPHIWPLLE